MSFSDTGNAKKYASIAEVAAAQAKLYAAELEAAPDYAAQAAASASSAASSAQVAVSAEGIVNNLAIAASESATAAAASAADAGNAAAAAVGQCLRVPEGEIIDVMPSQGGRTNTFITFDSAGNTSLLPKYKVAILDSDGKVPVSMIPAIAITQAFVVPSQAAMLALDAQVGDVAKRTDKGFSFILSAEPASTLSNWIQINDDVLAQLGLSSGATQVGAIDSLGNPTTVQAAIDAKISSSVLSSSNGALQIGYKETTVADALKYVVTPEMYGAVGDGVTNDVAAFEAAEADAFANNGMLEAHGTYAFSRGFQTRVPFDFSKAKFVIRDDWDGSTARYLINYRDPDIYTATMTITAARGASTIPALNTLKNHCVYIESTTEIAYVRAGANIMKQDTVHLINGEVQGLPLVYDFNSSCKITALPLRNAVHVYMPEVTFGVIPSTPINHILRIERSNVTSIGGKYDVRSQCVAQNRQAFNAFVNVTRYCYKTTVDGIEGHGWFTEDTGVTNPFSYAANLGGMYATAIRCSDPTIWGLVDGSVVKGMTIDSCMGARMGGHEDWYNLTIQNCTSYTRGFMIGSGRGHLRVLNCKHYYSTNVGNVIEFRYDYSNCCDGVVEIDGLNIYLSPAMPTYSAALKFQVAVSGSTYISSNTTAKTCDSLVIKNVNIHSETTQSNNFELWNVASDFTQNVQMPNQVVISNITTSGATNTSVRLNVCGSYYSTSTKMLQVTTDVYISDVKIFNPADVVQVSSRVPDSDKASVRNTYRWHFSNFRGLNINASLPPSWVFDIQSGCELYKIDGYTIAGMTDAAKYYVSDSLFSGVMQCQTNGGQIDLNNVKFTVSGVVTLNGVISASNVRLTVGSTISGQTTLTPALLMSYKNSAYYA